MKNLTEYLNESIFSSNCSDCRFQLNKQHKFLSKFIPDNAATINKFFDITNQRETGYELAEYGVLDTIEDMIELMEVQHDIQVKPHELRDIIKKSRVFKLSDVDDNFVWYMPAFDILAIDFKDIDELACIESYKEFYRKK